MGSKKSVIVINHGQGNIGSLVNTLNFLDIKNQVWSSEDDMNETINLNGFILPGVGAFNSGMIGMRRRGLDKVVNSLINKGIKGMGICLGMQMLCDWSEEDDFKEKGLGIFKGVVKKLQTKDGFVPNIGWNETYKTDRDKNTIFSEYDNQSFYYVHSYSVHAENHINVVATYKHGKSKITSAIYKQGIIGLQFHPEKSQQHGLSLLKNYFS